MSDEVTRKVEDAINSSGYPLEFYVGSKIKESGNIIWYNNYFFDYDLNQARTVDITSPAFHHQDLDKTEYTFSRELIVECKKSSDTAWVFFETPSIVQPNYMGQFFDFTHYVDGVYSSERVPWIVDSNLETHYGKAEGREKVAQNYQVVKIGGGVINDDQNKPFKRKDTIFEAANQVTKFMTWLTFKKEGYALTDFQNKGVFQIYDLFFPIIVYDGPLYTGFLEGDKISLSKTTNVILEYRYKPRYSSRERTYLIDIVKKEAFPDLIPTLAKDVDAIENSIKKNKDKIEKLLHDFKLTSERMKTASNTNPLM